MLHKLISMKGHAYQKLTIEKLLKQPILKEATLDVVVKSKLYETTYEIVGNMKEGWMGIKGFHTIDDMKAMNVLTGMVMSNSNLNLKVVGQLIRVNPRILNKGQGRKM